MYTASDTFGINAAFELFQPTTVIHRYSYLVESCIFGGEAANVTAKCLFINFYALSFEGFCGLLHKCKLF